MYDYTCIQPPIPSRIIDLRRVTKHSKLKVWCLMFYWKKCMSKMIWKFTKVLRLSLYLLQVPILRTIPLWIIAMCKETFPTIFRIKFLFWFANWRRTKHIYKHRLTKMTIINIRLQILFCLNPMIAEHLESAN